MDREVTNYHGDKFCIVCEEEEIQAVLTEQLIEPFREEIEVAWLSGTNAENWAKNYLSYVASLMVREPDKYNILSVEKLRAIQATEIPESQITDGVTEDFEPLDMRGRKTRNKNMRTETKFDRLMKIQKEFPDGRFTTCPVDTENVFKYRDKAYEISHDVFEYLPEVTKDGELYYPMDSILVLDDGDVLRFYDQNANPIGEEMIYEKQAWR